MITLTQLQKLFPGSLTQCAAFIGPLNQAMQEYGISTPARQAAFLAQVGHESMQLKATRELWGPTPAQKSYEPPSAKAKELGNTQPGDGFLFRGRGLIQITGRANYASTGQKLGLPLGEHPELLEGPVAASLSAALFWQSRGLNELADKGDFVTITRRINGGVNGLADRQALWAKAKTILGVQ